MNCPRCESKADMRAPDYGYGYGASYVCWGCDVYGRPFSMHGPEAKAESDEARAMSKAAADTRGAA